MTGMDFTGVTDAGIGTERLKRIWRGTTLAWDRYHWQKWNCIQKPTETTSLDCRATVAYNHETVSGRFYREMGGCLSAGVIFQSYSAKEVVNASLKELYEDGYRYFHVGDDVLGPNMVAPGNYFYELAGLTDGVMQVRVIYVVLTTSGYEYQRGTTLYEVLRGEPGDYPANGRHSDGFWYVLIGAIGYPTETDGKQMEGEKST